MTAHGAPENNTIAGRQFLRRVPSQLTMCRFGSREANNNARSRSGLAASRRSDAAPQLAPPEAAREVIIDHSRRLHERVTDGRARKLEAALAEISRSEEHTSELQSRFDLV